MGTNYGDGTDKTLPLKDALILNEPEVVEPPKPSASSAPKPKHQTILAPTAGGKAGAKSIGKPAATKPKAAPPMSKTDARDDDGFELTGDNAKSGTKDGR